MQRALGFTLPILFLLHKCTSFRLCQSPVLVIYTLSCACRSHIAGVKTWSSQAPHEFPHNFLPDASAPVSNIVSCNSQARKFMQESPSFIPSKYEANALIKWVHYFLLSGAEQIVIKERHGRTHKKLKAHILWGAQETGS